MVETSKTQPPSETAAGRAYKRQVKNVIIHKPMQREFSLVLISLLMISTLAIGFVIHHTIHAAVFGGEGFRFGKVSPYEILSDVSYQLIIRVSCVLFVTLIVIAAFGTLFLHRVAGPVYRFRLTFQSMNRGEVPRLIRLREGDFFAETANEINKTIKRVEFEHHRLQQLKDKLNQMEVARLSDAVSGKISELKVLCESQYKPEIKKINEEKRTF